MEILSFWIFKNNYSIIYLLRKYKNKNKNKKRSKMEKKWFSISEMGND